MWYALRRTDTLLSYNATSRTVSSSFLPSCRVAEFSACSMPWTAPSLPETNRAVRAAFNSVRLISRRISESAIKSQRPSRHPSFIQTYAVSELMLFRRSVTQGRSNSMLLGAIVEQSKQFRMLYCTSRESRCGVSSSNNWISRAVRGSLSTTSDAISTRSASLRQNRSSVRSNRASRV